MTYLELNTPRQMYLIAGRTTVFRIDGVFSLSFVLLQVHTHHTSLDLSLTPNWVHGESTRGRDVGAVAMVKVLQSSVDFYVNATADTKAIVMAAAYERKCELPIVYVSLVVTCMRISRLKTGCPRRSYKVLKGLI